MAKPKVDSKAPKTKPSTLDMLDLEDEEQIVDDLRGIPVDKFIYTNTRGILELSYAGTKWAIRKMAERGEAVRITGHPQITLCPMDSEYIVATVLAERVLIDRESGKEVRLDSTVGSSRNWKKQTLRDKKTVIPDPHFLKKAVSVATRNVQQMLMPFEFKKRMIDELSNPSKPKQTAPPKQPAQPSPPTSGQQPAQETKPPPVQTPKPEKPPESPNAPDPKKRQKLHILMGRWIKDAKTKKQAFVDLTGKQQTSELTELELSRLTAAFERMGEGKINELRKVGEKFTILEKSTGNTLFPVSAGAPAPPPETVTPDGAPPPSEDDMF